MNFSIAAHFLFLFSTHHAAAEQRGTRGLKSSKSIKSDKAVKAAKTAKSTEKITVAPTPPLPGVSNNGKPKLILAQDVDYPPYTGISDDFEMSGFGPDFAKGLEEVCNIDVTLVQGAWSDCWGNNMIGPGLLNGYYHACSTYTHTKGVRNRYLEFSAPILQMNKAAGILTRIEGGVPVVDGSSSLDGITVGDVVGWAPTSDVLSLSTNTCTNELFSSGINMVIPDEAGNDAALKLLLNGEVDALWIYADQAEIYSSACAEDSNQVWDCSMWSQFKNSFAYVNTGIYDYMDGGTTLAISKKGSGLSETLDPCIEAFMETESYKDLCVEYGLENDCFKNDFFDELEVEEKLYSKPTSELTTSCSDGYCSCP